MPGIQQTYSYPHSNRNFSSSIKYATSFITDRCTGQETSDNKKINVYRDHLISFSVLRKVKFNIVIKLTMCQILIKFLAYTVVKLSRPKPI